MSEKALVEISCKVRMDKEGSKAIAVSDGTMEDAKRADGRAYRREKFFWLPRSLIEVYEADDIVVMPEWLAKEKGLI